MCLRCLLHHILSLIAYTFRENREFVFIIIVQFMMSANSRMRFALQIVLVCLYSTPSHYHHCANLSEDIEFIKCLSDIFCRVCKIKHILTVIHCTICGAVCFQFTHSSCDDWDNIYILCLIIIIKSEVWTTTHYLGLGHETMVCAVCLFMFPRHIGILFDSTCSPNDHAFKFAKASIITYIPLRKMGNTSIPQLLRKW